MADGKGAEKAWREARLCSSSGRYTGSTGPRSLGRGSGSLPFSTLNMSAENSDVWRGKSSSHLTR